MEWQGYKNYDHSFNLEDYDHFLEELNRDSWTKDGNYLNIPASFDIETTSTYLPDGSKFAFMYIWQVCIDGSTIYGRTWTEFQLFLSRLTKDLKISMTNRLILYVHNLGFELQFIKDIVLWAKKDGHDMIFSVKSRKPIYAVSQLGIEFRCSYLLSNYNLANLGAEIVKKYPVKKMVGDLDYSLIRHSKTPLSDKELEYCFNDVRVVTSYIQEKIENEGGINSIELTNTGYVRTYCRDYCYGEFIQDKRLKQKRMFEYHDLMKMLQLNSSHEYGQLKAAFAGGFTHPSPIHCGEVLSDVGSIDFASSYPGQMVMEPHYPMGKSTHLGKVDLSRLRFLLENYCCLFKLTIYDVYAEFPYDYYISVSKCNNLSKDYVAFNGRVVSADYLEIMVTEQDFDIIERVYNWSKIEVDDMRVYRRGYLPRPLIMAVLELYQAKTSLKGVEGKDVEYMVSKNMINASYGMMVTDIIRDEIIMSDGKWSTQDADEVSQLKDYNKKFTRFLYYPWGVWVTANARHALWEGIFEFGEDYVYSDTDSIKCLNITDHMDFINKYNLSVRQKLLQMCIHYHIDFNLVNPKSSKGDFKMIGVWDKEPGYKKFKTIGAKRYMYINPDGSLSLTTSGVNKKHAVPYLLNKFCDIPLELSQLAYSPDPNKKKESKEAMKQLLKYVSDNNISYDSIFEAFNEALHIPAEHSGKLTHTYIDDPKLAKITDYTGITTNVFSPSATHLEPASYDFNNVCEVINILKGYSQHEA